MCSCLMVVCYFSGQSWQGLVSDITKVYQVDKMNLFHVALQKSTAAHSPPNIEATRKTGHESNSSSRDTRRSITRS